MSVLMIGLRGPVPDATEARWLSHPWVGGVILFARNLTSAEQIRTLTAMLREWQGKRMVLAIDQEGGRVQRLRDYTEALPAMAALGAIDDPQRRAQAIDAYGCVLAAQLVDFGFDLSFAPVLDLAAGSAVIGDRAFASDPDRVASCAAAVVAAFHRHGLPAIGKHAPGHGRARADSHLQPAIDESGRIGLWTQLWPFAHAIDAGVDGLMLAHVCYPDFATGPAGSARRVIELLRSQLGYRGVLYSDDIGMVGAHEIGDSRQRVAAHLAAGCDQVLVCDPQDVDQVLAGLHGPPPRPRVDPLRILRKPRKADADELAQAQRQLAEFA